MSPDGCGKALPHDGDFAGQSKEGNGGRFNVCKIEPPGLAIPQPAVPSSKPICVRVCLSGDE